MTPVKDPPSSSRYFTPREEGCQVSGLNLWQSPPTSPPTAAAQDFKNNAKITTTMTTRLVLFQLRCLVTPQRLPTQRGLTSLHGRARTQTPISVASRPGP